MISIISIEESEKWDQIVKSFKNFDVYFLSNYSKSFKIHGDGEPILFYYEESDVKAMNVVMKRDIAREKRFERNLPEKEYYDITTPYGYGGFVIEGEVTEDCLNRLNKEYILLCKREKIICEFVRFHPVLNNCELLQDIYDVSNLGKTILMNLKSKEQIWSELTSKNRNVIRKAKKFGVEIYYGINIQLIEEFMNLYHETMARDNAKDYYYFAEDFYKSILQDLKYNTIIFYAMYEGKIIAMSMIMQANQKLHYHLSASIKEYQHLAPTNLLLYEVACWGVENGYKSFHLGGGLGSKEDSLFKFKKAFNRNSHLTYSIGRKIFDIEKYEKLVNLRSESKNIDKSTSFFPVYRTISDDNN